MPKTSPSTTQEAEYTAQKTSLPAHTKQSIKRRDIPQVLKNAYYFIWSVLGLILIVLLSVAIFGGDSWVKNLNIASETPPASEQQPPAAQPQQPPQPTEDQLDCVRQEVGEERFSELEQGDAANEEENSIIQECLQA